jgi:putative endonuclease
MNKTMITAYTKGVHGEKKAELFLKKHGYVMHKRRFKTPYGEIDLIAQKHDTLIFVEVKHRTTLAHAMHSISVRQQHRIGRAALFFIQNHCPHWKGTIQFDGVFMDNNGSIHHVPCLFEPSQCMS